MHTHIYTIMRRHQLGTCETHWWDGWDASRTQWEATHLGTAETHWEVQLMSCLLLQEQAGENTVGPGKDALSSSSVTQVFSNDKASHLASWQKRNGSKVQLQNHTLEQSRVGLAQRKVKLITGTRIEIFIDEIIGCLQFASKYSCGWGYKWNIIVHMLIIVDVRTGI